MMSLIGKEEEQEMEEEEEGSGTEAERVVVFHTGFGKPSTFHGDN